MQLKYYMLLCMSRVREGPRNSDLSLFGCMHEVWTIPTANMTYTRLQNYTNMMVGEHGIQTFGVVVVYIISFIVFFFFFFSH